MPPVGGDQLTMALNPSKRCTVVRRGPDLGARRLNNTQLNEIKALCPKKKQQKKQIQEK